MIRTGIKTGAALSTIEAGADVPRGRSAGRSRDALTRTNQLADRLTFDFEAFDQFVRSSTDPLSFMAPARLSTECSGQLKLFLGSARAVIGVDEVGRGCLAGPVVAGAVLLPDIQQSSEIAERLAELDDSKKLTPQTREDLARTIRGCAHYAVAEASPEEIDTINIFHASLLAMKRAVMALVAQAKLDLSKMLILIDGNKPLRELECNQLSVIKGDTRSAAIAAASVVAKVHRDAFMTRLAEEYPQYHWQSNKGYPSIDHRLAIAAHGMTPWHRRSFRCLPDENDNQSDRKRNNGSKSNKGSRGTNKKNSSKAKTKSGKIKRVRLFGNDVKPLSDNCLQRLAAKIGRRRYH